MAEEEKPAMPVTIGVMARQTSRILRPTEEGVFMEAWQPAQLPSVDEKGAADIVAGKVEPNKDEAETLFLLGSNYYSGTGAKKDLKQAYQYLGKAAEMGHAKAQFKLAIIYEHGYAGVKKDMAKVAELYKKASDQGHIPACFNLGVCYLDGTGVEKDEAKGLELVRKAKQAGLSYAGVTLGNCYSEGRGVEENKEKAVELYREGAEAGVLEGMHALAYCYEHGEGVALNLEQALHWYNKLAEKATAEDNKSMVKEARNSAKRVEKAQKNVPNKVWYVHVASAFPNGVNVRKGPSMQHKAVAKLKTGDKIEELETDGDWIRHKKGWCKQTWNGYRLLWERENVTEEEREQRIYGDHASPEEAKAEQEAAHDAESASESKGTDE